MSAANQLDKAKQGKSSETTIAGMLADPRVKSQLELAIPKHLTPDRLARVAMTEIRQSPNLMKCKPESLLGAIMKATGLGLEVGSSIGESYLVPYKTEATFIIGYKGLIKLALQSGSVKSIQAHCVYENDEFEYQLGLHEILNHKPALSNRGKLLAVYGIAHLTNGGTQFEVMSVEDVEAIRQGSPGRNSDAWKGHFSEMARKTVVRRLCKFLPLSPEAHSGVHADEAGDRGEQSNSDWFEAAKDVTPAPAKVAAKAVPKLSFAQAADQLNHAADKAAGDNMLKHFSGILKPDEIADLAANHVAKWGNNGQA